MNDPADLENGTEVYVTIGTGTVVKGTIVGREELKRKYAYSDYDDADNLVRVDIDWGPTPTGDEVPDHIAPDKFQTGPSDALFRDAYTIDAEEQHYIVRPDNLVKVLS